MDTADLADQTDSTSVDKIGTKSHARSLVLTHKGYASLDPTTRADWLVKGETELGPQRRCVGCGQFWPLEKGNWLLRRRWVKRLGSGRPFSGTKAEPRNDFIQPCRACRVERGMRAA